MARVLVSPLSWGLGHATRDIPIIRELLSHGHEVTIATSGGALELLKQEFPGCNFIHFEDYPAPYSPGRYFIPKFIASIPRMMGALADEKKNAEHILSENRYDAVISDNRFGVYSEKAPSFLIAHQLRFSAPYYLRPLETASQYVTERFHKKFLRVIVPDNSSNCLSGKLCRSSRKTTNAKAYYAGILSSIHKTDAREDVDFLISISGPEPQRSKLEELLLRQAQTLPGEKVILLGRPQDNLEKKLDAHTTLRSHATGEERLALMNRAKFIISRSGYTTMMDIAEIEKKRGLFIPTPGQTEQEYLSRYYEEQGWFHSKSQYALDLSGDIAAANSYAGFPKMPKSKDNARKLYDEVLAPHLA